ncbi:MAG: BamA/TamA family outer membrane protein, partial [candidate division Zixibacteria bacterium]|nr:BamA/TamA family outer membrane protein [candidate division Zixibacteria bacterium]
LIEIDEGIISEIRVEGNHRTKNWVILRSFPLRVGKPYNSSLADEGIENIYATELFDKVTLKILPSERGPILDISVKEKDFTFLRIGMHYNDEHNLESALQLMDANILGIGNKTYADLLYGNTKQRYGLHFKADRIYKSYLTYRADIFHQREKRKIYFEHREIDSFREWITGTVFSLGQHISRLGTLSLETKLERVELREGKVYTKEVNDIRSIALRSLVDTFDKYPFPDKGKYHHLYIEVAGKVLKGDLTFRKGFTSLESYFPLSQHWNFHPKVALGISDGNLPTSEQFLLGGYNELYGFFQDELRGDKLICGNLEVRFKFWQRFYWNVRYDIGNVWSEPDDFEMNDIHHAIGTGLAIDTPLGPAQIHYGYAGKGTDKVYVRAGFEF